jgi:hypothetical protein
MLGWFKSKKAPQLPPALETKEVELERIIVMITRKHSDEVWMREFIGMYSESYGIGADHWFDKWREEGKSGLLEVQRNLLIPIADIERLTTKKDKVKISLTKKPGFAFEYGPICNDLPVDKGLPYR